MQDGERDGQAAALRDMAGRIRGTVGQACTTAEDRNGDVPAEGLHASAGTESGLEAPGTVFFATIEMTRMPMVITDPNRPDNPVVFANAAFLDLTGYQRKEIYGHNCRFLQGALTSHETVRQLREAVAQRRPVAVEILNYRKDGTHFWNALFIGPVYDEAGRLLYFFSSQLDITNRRSSEDAFRQAQKMEAIGQLTAGLAHDFNNTLQVILGNLRRAEANPGDEAMVRRSVERALRAGDQAAKLTRQLVTFARKTRLEPAALDLSALVGEFAEMLSRTLGGGIEVAYDLAPDLPPCVLDAVHAEMALLNVLANARDAMPDGGRVTVRTGTAWLDEAAVALGGEGMRPGRYVTLGVEDDGPGMPSEVLARAAEPFFTTKPGKGSGLGLAMVHGFVRQSCGRLEISSEPGGGTSVRMLFPVASQAGPCGPPPAQASPLPDAPGGVETILAVDDNEDVLELAVHLLGNRGYRVLSATSGEEALRLLEQGGDRVDLLFSDIVMPGGMTGLALAERARALRPSLRVLLATGYNEDLARGRATSEEVLGKPYLEAELMGRIRASLNRPDREDAPRHR
jgi:PAS domain S-box-containing protein